jgi:hypothetical protein
MLMTACSGNTIGTPSGFPRKIIPMPEGGGSTQPLFNQNDTESESYLQMPKIALGFDEKLVQVLTTNLDADEANEQVIVAKGADREGAPLKIIIADYENAQNGYVRSWESGIGALDEKTIRLAAKDVIGNHTIQIITTGMNRTNQASLSAFKITSPPGARLTYVPIFQLDAEVSVEIEESDRGVGYSEGYSFGASFPIVVFRNDPAAADTSSIIRDTYEYAPALQRYTLQRHETIKVEKAATEQLAGLLQNSSPDLLKKYVQGIWYKADESGKNDEKVMAINPDTGEIAFYNQNSQEVYTWKYSRRSLYNTLHIYAESALLKSVQPNITVVLNSPAELSIEITDYSAMEQWLNVQWGGAWVKRSRTEMTAVRQAESGPAQNALLPAAGEYLSQNGVRLTLASPTFFWQEGSHRETGGYSIFMFDSRGKKQYVLSLKTMTEQGLNAIDRFFTMELKGPALKEGAPLQSFTLRPAQTTVYGIVNLKGQPLSFTRQAR